MNTIVKHEIVGNLRESIEYYEKELRELVGQSPPTKWESPEVRSFNLKEYFEKTLNPLIKTFISMDLDVNAIENTLIHLAEFQRCARRVMKAFHPKGAVISKESLIRAIREESHTISDVIEYSYDLNRELESLYRKVHPAKTHHVKFNLIAFRNALKALMPFVNDSLDYRGGHILVDVQWSEMTLYGSDGEIVGIQKIDCRSDTVFSFGVLVGTTKQSGFSLLELLSTYGEDAKIELELFELNYMIHLKISETSSSHIGRVVDRYRLWAVDSQEFDAIKINSSKWGELFSIRYSLYKEHYESYKDQRKLGNYTPEDHFGIWFWDAVKILNDFNTSSFVGSHIQFLMARELKMIANNGWAYAEINPYINDIYDKYLMDTVISVNGNKLKKLCRFFEKSEANVFLSDGKDLLIFQSIDKQTTVAINIESVRNVNDEVSWHTSPKSNPLFSGEINEQDGKVISSLVGAIRKDKYHKSEDQGLEFIFNSTRIKSIKTLNTKTDFGQDVDWVHSPSSDEVQTVIINEVRTLLPFDNVMILKKVLPKIMGNKNLPFTFWYDVSMRDNSKDIYSERFLITFYAHDMVIVFLMKRIGLDTTRVDNYNKIKVIVDELNLLKNKFINMDQRNLLLKYPVYKHMDINYSMSLHDFDAPDEWLNALCSLSEDDIVDYKRFYMLYVSLYEIVRRSYGKITLADLKHYDPFNKQEYSVEPPYIGDSVSDIVDETKDLVSNMTLEESLDYNWWGLWASYNASILYLEKKSREHRMISIKKSHYRKDMKEYLEEYDFDFEIIEEYSDGYRILIHGDDNQVIHSRDKDERSLSLDPREYYLLKDDVIKIKGSSSRVVFY